MIKIYKLILVKLLTFKIKWYSNIKEHIIVSNIKYPGKIESHLHTLILHKHVNITVKGQ